MEIALTNISNTIGKSVIIQSAEDLVRMYPPENLLALAVRLELLAEEIRKHTKAAQLDADKLHDLGVELGESVRYDYSNSPAWVYLQEKLKSATAQIKADIKEVESLAKILHGAWERGGAAVSSWTDRETGEILEVRPAKKLVSNKLTLL